MVYLGLKINDSDLNQWLDSKKNKSKTTKDALKLLYNSELNKKTPKIVKGVIVG